MNNPTLGGSCTARMTRADSDVSNRVVDVFELNTPTIMLFERFSTTSCVPLFSLIKLALDGPRKTFVLQKRHFSLSGQTFEAMQGFRLASGSRKLVACAPNCRETPSC